MYDNFWDLVSHLHYGSESSMRATRNGLGCMDQALVKLGGINHEDNFVHHITFMQPFGAAGWNLLEVDHSVIRANARGAGGEGVQLLQDTAFHQFVGRDGVVWMYRRVGNVVALMPFIKSSELRGTLKMARYTCIHNASLDNASLDKKGSCFFQQADSCTVLDRIRSLLMWSMLLIGTYSTHLVDCWRDLTVLCNQWNRRPLFWAEKMKLVGGTKKELIFCDLPFFSFRVVSAVSEQIPGFK